MGTPSIGSPPTKEEMIQFVESYIDDKYRYGPLEHVETSGDVLFFKSRSVPVQVEFEPDEGTWGEEFDALYYRVYEVPPQDDGFYKETRSPFDLPFNPSLTWEKALSKTLMAVSGSINGALNRGEIEP